VAREIAIEPFADHHSKHQNLDSSRGKMVLSSLAVSGESRSSESAGVHGLLSEDHNIASELEPEPEDEAVVATYTFEV
jgi:hypothetical protein